MYRSHVYPYLDINKDVICLESNFKIDICQHLIPPILPRQLTSTVSPSHPGQLDKQDILVYIRYKSRSIQDKQLFTYSVYMCVVYIYIRFICSIKYVFTLCFYYWILLRRLWSISYFCLYNHVVTCWYYLQCLHDQDLPPVISYFSTSEQITEPARIVRNKLGLSCAKLRASLNFD